MHPDFWIERWRRGEIGWHRDTFDRHLTELWPRMGLPAATQVFVPLCGKSLDLLWLASRGHRVLGVELSATAVEAFFAENGLAPERVPLDESNGAAGAAGPLTLWRADEVAILCGDFFDLAPEHLVGTGAIYDRAALIALPPDLRRRYAAHLEVLLPASVPHLLVTLEYDQSRMAGPPFAVHADEVETLFGARCRVSALADLDVLAESPGLRARGLGELHERVYRLDPKV